MTIVEILVIRKTLRISSRKRSNFQMETVTVFQHTEMFKAVVTWTAQMYSKIQKWSEFSTIKIIGKKTIYLNSDRKTCTALTVPVSLSIVGDCSHLLPLLEVSVRNLPVSEDVPVVTKTKGRWRRLLVEKIIPLFPFSFCTSIKQKLTDLSTAGVAASCWFQKVQVG